MQLQENDLLVAGYVICYDLFLSFSPHTQILIRVGFPMLTVAKRLCLLPLSSEWSTVTAGICPSIRHETALHSRMLPCNKTSNS